MGRRPPGRRGWPTHLPSLFGPMVAALVCAGLADRRTLRDLLGRMVRWRIGWRWWIAAVSPALALGGVLAVLAVAGGPLPSPSGFAGFSGVPSGWGVAGVTAVVLAAALGEETGWRGWLLPAALRRTGPVRAALLVAAVWAGWHVPQFFLVGTYEGFAPAMVPVFLLGLAGGSVVLTWLYVRTGSVLAAAVWHGLYNVAGATAAAAAHGGVVAAAVWTFVVLFAAVLLAGPWRSGRPEEPQVHGPGQQDDADVREQPGPDVMPEEGHVDADDEGDHGHAEDHQPGPSRHRTPLPPGPRVPGGRRSGAEPEVVAPRAHGPSAAGAQGA